MTVQPLPPATQLLVEGCYLLVEFDHGTAHLTVLGDQSYSEENRDDALTDARAAAEEAARTGRRVTYTVVELAGVAGGYTTYDAPGR